MYYKREDRSVDFAYYKPHNIEQMAVSKYILRNTEGSSNESFFDIVTFPLEQDTAASGLIKGAGKYKDLNQAEQHKPHSAELLKIIRSYKL
jgi:hypothetical protein